MICIVYRGSIIMIAMEQRLREALSRRQKRRIIDARLVPAAVLVPIYYKQGQCYILFTKRTDRVKEHKGQISFPGGAFQEGDLTLIDTALRECAEEIGLMAEQVEVLGELDDTLTETSNYIISPFVGLVPWPYQFKVDGWETEELIEAPISALQDKSCLRQETKIIGGQAVTSYFYHYQGKVIWGATARILHQLLEIFVQAERAA